MKILRNRAVVALVAIAAAFTLAFVVVPFIGRTEAQKTEIVRVVNPVKKGTVITEDDVKLVTVGGYNLPADTVKSLDKVVGKYTLADLSTDDYILSGKLSDQQHGTNDKLLGLNGTQKAISVKIDSLEIGLSGMLLPGDIVTVYAVASDGKMYDTSALQYVEVLTATTSNGVDTSEVNESGEASDLPKTVTLLVDETQASKIAELNKNAALHIALSYRGDEQIAQQFLEAQATLFGSGGKNG